MEAVYYGYALIQIKKNLKLEYEILEKKKSINN